MLLSHQAEFDGLKTFTGMQEAFAQAKQRTPDRCSEFFCTFAGKLSRLEIVGQQLAQKVLLPFSHLRVIPLPSDIPRLTINLWDTRETPVPAETTAISSDFEPHSQLKVSRDGRF